MAIFSPLSAFLLWVSYQQSSSSFKPQLVCHFSPLYLKGCRQLLDWLLFHDFSWALEDDVSAGAPFYFVFIDNRKNKASAHFTLCGLLKLVIDCVPPIVTTWWVCPHSGRSESPNWMWSHVLCIQTAQPRKPPDCDCVSESPDMSSWSLISLNFSTNKACQKQTCRNCRINLKPVWFKFS